MWHFRDVIGWQQIVGSAFDIAIRLYFVSDPSRCFASGVEDDDEKKGEIDESTEGQPLSPYVSSKCAAEQVAGRSKRSRKIDPRSTHQ